MRRVILLLLLAVSTAGPAHAATRTIGQITITADESRAHPGGFLDVRVRSRSRRGIGAQVLAVLDGRRIGTFPSGGALRALVPIPVTFWPGETTLGIELRTRRGRQRIPVQVTVREHVYPTRSTVIPETKRAAVETPAATRDGRELLQYLRTDSPVQRWRGPFRPPVDAAAEASFGAPQTYEGGRAVEAKIDAVWGEYHRGLDYPVTVGTTVRAPAAGTVLLADALALSGRTVVLDHGHGLVSVFYHLERIATHTGDDLAAGATIGLSGESGIAAAPHLHWGTYLHTVAIDPRLTFALE